VNKKKYTIDVVMYIRGNELDPDAVTKTLGVNPSNSYRKGKGRVALKSCEVVANTGVWSLRADSDSSMISDHVAQLLSNLPPDRGVLNGLRGVEDAFIDIFMALPANKNGEGTCEFNFTTENVAALAKTGLPVFVTVCVVKE
jgi:hypothetical protein